MIRLLAVALLLGLALASCSPSAEEPQAEPAVMRFTVIDALLGPPVRLEDPAFEIRPPKDWLPLDSLRVGQLGASMNLGGDAAFRLEPRMVFMDPAAGSVLFVTRWHADSSASWKQVEARQRQVQDTTMVGRTVQHDAFVLAGQSCLQTLVQDSLMVGFKLLLACGVQLDYVVPRAVYDSQVELIESSLGSVVVPTSSSQQTGETQ